MALVTLGDFALIVDNVLARVQTATGRQRAAAVAAIRGPRRSFDRNRPRGTLNDDMKNIPLMRVREYLTCFLPEPRM